MKIKQNMKVRLFFLILIGLLFGVRQIYALINYITLDDDLAPIMLCLGEEDELIWYYFQNEKPVEKIWLSENIEIDAEFDLNTEKQEVLLKIYDNSDKTVKISKYNYIMGDFEILFTVDDVEEILDGDITEIHFIPNSNNISFISGDAICVWDYDKKQGVKLYSFNSSHFGNHGFAYYWKNSEEMYLVECDNLVLYNSKTKKSTIIVESIGKVYFRMSDDNEYMVWQKQWGKRQEIVLMNMNTEEKRIIHVAKSTCKVDIQFSPNNKYIFMKDWHRDSYSGIRYWYLYNMKMERKFSIDVDYPKAGIVGW